MNFYRKKSKYLMGILSGIGRSIGGLIFTVSLILAIAMVGIVWLTTYENIKPLAFDVFIQKFAGEGNQSQIEEWHKGIVMMCNFTGNQSVYIPVGKDMPNLEVNCSDIPEESELPKVIFAHLFDYIYYKEYDCWFPNCVTQAMTQGGQEAVLLLLTSKANSFFHELQTYALIGIVIGAILIIVSTRKLAAIAKSIGISLIVTAIPFLLMPITQKLWPLPEEMAQIAFSIINQMVEIMTPYVLVIFVTGIALVVTGVLLSRRGKGIEKAQKVREK